MPDVDVYSSLVTFNKPTSSTNPLKQTRVLFSAEWTGTSGTFVFLGPSALPAFSAHTRRLYAVNFPGSSHKCLATFSKLHFQQLVPAFLTLFTTPTLFLPPPPLQKNIVLSLGLKEHCSSRIIKCLWSCDCHVFDLQHIQKKKYILPLFPSLYPSSWIFHCLMILYSVTRALDRLWKKRM